jgi:hypothetical protein
MAGRYAGEPEDARRGQVVALPTDVDEAKADREMADAERAVALGTASEEQRAAVDRIAHARTQEERRSLWMAN